VDDRTVLNLRDDVFGDRAQRRVAGERLIDAQQRRLGHRKGH
jgi:hypothetical protein